MPRTPDITEAEWSLMDALWSASPKSATDLHEGLKSAQGWSLATVKTLLTRLSAKGAVRHEKDGKRFLYRPAVTRAAAIKAEGRSLLRRTGRDSRSPLIAYFLKEGRLQADEIAELRGLLDELEERGRS